MNIPATFFAYFLCFLLFAIAPAIAYLNGLEKGRKEGRINKENMWWNGAQEACQFAYREHSYAMLDVHNADELYSDFVVEYTGE